MTSLTNTLDALDWANVKDRLNRDGFAVLPKLLSAADCRALASLYDGNEDDGEPASARQRPLFRSRVIMQNHHFGHGEYQYFSYPLPRLVQALRTALYPHLAAVANHWQDHMNLPLRFPATHEEFLARCHAAGQTRPTPLLIQYVAGDYNCLHQDLYGEHVFPLQAVLLLAEPQRDFDGGELVLTEQRPRAQSRATVVPLSQGDVALFPVNQRPVSGTKGSHRVTMRHGVSAVRSGRRHTLGIIFHDAA